MSHQHSLTCPNCGSEEVTVTAEQSFMVNSGEHYCHSVKTHDPDAKSNCLACGWAGQRQELKPLEGFVCSGCGKVIQGDLVNLRQAGGAQLTWHPKCYRKATP